VLCLPYYQSLLLAGMTGVVSFLLLTLLLLFVVVQSPEIYRTVTACLQALPLSWLPPVLNRRGHWVLTPLRAMAHRPSLAPLFQRPPPIFS
jgi:hypothetical protein